MALRAGRSQLRTRLHHHHLQRLNCAILRSSVVQQSSHPNQPQQNENGEEAMSMKSANAPRRVYSRNNVLHVLFAGEHFGTKADSKIIANGDGTITVTQRKPGKAGVSETWGKVKVPCNARA